MAIDNIYYTVNSTATETTPTRYLVPLAIPAETQQVEVTVSIGVETIILFFSLNSISNSIMLSAYTLNKTQYYFLGYQCVFGTYINEVDNGCPYKFYFVDKSNGQNYALNSKNIDFNALINGVALYAELR